jgi:hypothetical protein
MRGLFITVQGLFLGAGAACGYVGARRIQNAPLLVDFVALLFVVALALTLFTCFAIQHRRHREPGAPVPGTHLQGDTDQLGEMGLDEEHPFAPSSQQNSEHEC